MAGKRQHFIPKFLQDGFASHTKNDEVYTWVYRKATQAFNTNIVNVGVEGHFYADDRQVGVDDLITEAEGCFADLVYSLRTNGPAEVHDADLPRLLAHLEVRTRHLRQNFLQIGDSLASMLLDFVSDASSFGNYIERRLRDNPSLLRDHAARELLNYGLPEDLIDMITESDSFLAEAMEQIRSDLPQMAEILRSTLPEAVRSGGRSGHIRALRQSISPEFRVQRYGSLAYSVLAANNPRLILGDSAVLFRVEGTRAYKPFLDKSDVLHSVILPLTPGLALIGSHESVSVLAPELPKAIARCSLEYFIAAEKTDSNNLLKEIIGEDATLFTRQDLEQILTELIRG